MRIAQFILNLDVGGAESIVKDYSIAFKKNGIDVEVITLLPFTNSINEEQIRDYDIDISSIYEEIYKFKSTNVILRALRKPFRTKKVSKWLLNHIKQNNITVLHCHLSLLEYLLPIRDEIKDVKLVYTCHNEANYYFGDNNEKYTKYAKTLIKDNNMQIIALHDRMKNELNEIFGINNTIVLNNPINIERFFNCDDNSEQIRQELGIPQDSFVIGHIGRFTYQKNHEFLVDVFNEIYKTNKNAFLLMVGKGELKDDIVAKLNKFGLQEKYLILQDRKDIERIVKIMDAFVFPSRFEGLSVALIEVQTRVKRIVVSKNVPCFTDVTGNVKFIDLNEDKEIWASKALSNDFKEIVVDSFDKYSLNKIVNSLLEIYKK